MVKASPDGYLEVRTSDAPDASGHYTVEIRNLKSGKFLHRVVIHFGSNGSETAFSYNSQDTSKGPYTAKGTRRETVTNITFANGAATCE
jgi:hypothetical protein